MKRGAWRRVVWAGVSLAVILTGCSTLAPESKSPEETVRLRAEERWAALIKGDFQRAYDLTSPGFRAVVPPDRFASQFGGGGRWTRASVTKVQCEKDRCDVTVQIDAQVAVRGRAPMMVGSSYDEIWVREDGQWWKFEKL